MKKFNLIFILIMLTLSVTLFGACSTSVHVSDSSSAFVTNSSGATDFTITVKPTEHGTIIIGENKTHAKFGEKIDINIHADSGYEVGWVKINHGNRAEDKIVYFSQDIHEGAIYNLSVEYNMEIEALFVVEGSIERVSHSYVGQPSNSSSVQTHFNVVSVQCVNGSVTANLMENVEVGQTVQVTATPNDGFSLNEIIVRNAQDYTLIEVDENGCFVMPNANVAIMASFT